MFRSRGRPAKFTKAELARAIRAAQETGAGKVVILADRRIEIDPRPVEGDKRDQTVAPGKELVF